jgi:dihydrofolate reductase
MRNLILEEWISLDGFISDKNGKLDFFAPMVRDIYSDARHSKFLESIDLILLGRQTYEQFVQVWPSRTTDTDALANMINRTRKLVFSNTITNAPWGTWPAAEVVSGDAISQLKKLKSLSGKNIIVWGSISLAHAFMKENLIDEYHLHVCPTLTCGGRRLFTEDMNPSTLSLIDTKHYYPGTVFIQYQPQSPA